MPSNQVHDFPDPTLAPADIDLIAISAFDSTGFPLELNPQIVWRNLQNLDQTGIPKLC